jgi:predicted RNase H-like HicB family nuclease
MKNVKIWNTKKRGVFEFLVYPDGKRLVGVCLTLNIIEEGESPKKLLRSLEEAAFGYLEVVRKENLSDELLNRPALKKYWDKYYTAKLLRKAEKPLQKSTSSLTPFPVKQELVYT